MPELRLNVATREWVIVATERAKRPHEFKSKEPKPQLPAFSEKCPFCPGNEHQTPPEILAYRQAGTQANTRGWWIRIIPNKFSALVPSATLKRKENGKFFAMMDGFGFHEVVIEMPEHNKTIGTISDKQTEEIFLSYRDRYNQLACDKRIQLITIFRNHGAQAGTSLEHPHSQIIATPIVPGNVRHRMDTARGYYDDTGSCLFCNMIKEDLRAGERIVLETERFVVIEPFASMAPFATLIVPKYHRASFGDADVEEVKELGRVANNILGRFYRHLDDPDYNYMVRTPPIVDSDVAYYHWYLKIQPRLTKAAGFELGSGIYITTIKPEDTAEFLRTHV